MAHIATKNLIINFHRAGFGPALLLPNPAAQVKRKPPAAATFLTSRPGMHRINHQGLTQSPQCQPGYSGRALRNAAGEWNSLFRIYRDGRSRGHAVLAASIMEGLALAKEKLALSRELALLVSLDAPTACAELLRSIEALHERLATCCKKVHAALTSVQEHLPRELAGSDVVRHWIQRARQNITFIGKEEQ